jgi:hypothetical protein
LMAHLHITKKAAQEAGTERRRTGAEQSPALA